MRKGFASFRIVIVSEDEVSQFGWVSKIGEWIVDLDSEMHLNFAILCRSLLCTIGHGDVVRKVENYYHSKYHFCSLLWSRMKIAFKTRATGRKCFSYYRFVLHRDKLFENTRIVHSQLKHRIMLFDIII